MSRPDGYWTRQIDPWPLMTSNMMTVLEFLQQAQAEGWEFVSVDSVPPQTLKSLVNRDWIFASAGADGTRYKITDRGRRAFKAYSQTPPHRFDDICPTCQIRPKHVRKSGMKEAYCLECANETKRKAYALKRPNVKEGRMCSRCGKRPVHTHSGGRAITYCLHCKNVRNRRRKRQDRKKDVALAQQGVVKLCARPGCTRPRHVSPSSVLDWCREHYREWYNEYRHKKKAGRTPGKIGRPRKSEVQQ